MNPNEPLGLRAGSVRALLALIVVGVTFARIALGAAVDPTLLWATYGVMAAYSLMRVAPNGTPLGTTTTTETPLATTTTTTAPPPTQP
jgi:hypothetical protein